jgi:hypothetical protein
MSKYRVLGVDTVPSVGQTFTDRDTVLAVQTALKSRGFDPGTLDGVMGPNTAAAIRRMQAADGAPQTGVIDYGVLSALKVQAPSAQKTKTIVDATQMAIDQANNADTPAGVKSAASSMMSAMKAAVDAPPEVRGEVAKAKAKADSARTPEEVKDAAADVKAASKLVLASSTGFFDRTPWWQLALLGLGGLGMSYGLYALVRGRR